MPNRFFLGSSLSLPFDDNAFHTLASTDCMEHLSPQDVPLALKEMYRVCQHYLFLQLATIPDSDNYWHLTVEPRQWWEKQCFAAGFRKHPRYYQIGYDLALMLLKDKKLENNVLYVTPGMAQSLVVKVHRGLN
ncbi:MAG: class I SAM-dependent methyltransferase [Gammaproteobacteria bacterium]|nr:class I SAM-dependent methyltransferase [Gammaproteobacteria bacterium]